MLGGYERYKSGGFIFARKCLISGVFADLKKYNTLKQCSNQREIKQVGKSEHQSIFVVLTHSCYHIKENLPKEGGFP